MLLQLVQQPTQAQKPAQKELNRSPFCAQNKARVDLETQPKPGPKSAGSAGGRPRSTYKT